jgi:hypothetical protein
MFEVFSDTLESDIILLEDKACQLRSLESIAEVKDMKYESQRAAFHGKLSKRLTAGDNSLSGVVTYKCIDPRCRS